MSTYDLIGRLLLAVLLSGLIGLEREVRQKHAGLRTHALVGLGAALIIEVSTYGFSDALIPSKVVLDPSRVAAQVVSGIGFIGAGLIFVRQEYVRGLTTAASIWLTAAVGLAAGAGMWEISLAGTVLGLVVVEGLEQIEMLLHRSELPLIVLEVTFFDAEGTVLPQIVDICEQSGSAAIASIRLRRQGGDSSTSEAHIRVNSGMSQAEIVRGIAGLSGVLEVSAENP